MVDLTNVGGKDQVPSYLFWFWLIQRDLEENKEGQPNMADSLYEVLCLIMSRLSHHAFFPSSYRSLLDILN